MFSATNLPEDCINLGQGYMNFAPPKWITDAADEALRTVGPNHYSHPKGRLRLRQAIKDFYGPSFGRELNVESEILVTSGANEGETNVMFIHWSINNIEFRDRTIFCIHSFP